MRGRHGFSEDMRDLKMGKDKEREQEMKREKTDLERAAESFAKYRSPESDFLRDYIQQSHNGPVIDEPEEDEEIEL